MNVHKLYVDGVPGQTFVQDALLSFVEILLAQRECEFMEEVFVAPVGNKFFYVGAMGKCELDPTLPIQTVTVNMGAFDIVRPERFYFEYKF
jgi:hypothetical protein